MAQIKAPDACLKLNDGDSFEGKQGFSYLGGISKESAGAKAICMHLLEVPPGGWPTHITTPATKQRSI